MNITGINHGIPTRCEQGSPLFQLSIRFPRNSTDEKNPHRSLCLTRIHLQENGSNFRHEQNKRQDYNLHAYKG